MKDELFQLSDSSSLFKIGPNNQAVNKIAIKSLTNNFIAIISPDQINAIRKIGSRINSKNRMHERSRLRVFSAAVVWFGIVLFLSFKKEF